MDKLEQIAKRNKIEWYNEQIHWIMRYIETRGANNRLINLMLKYEQEKRNLA
jgi:hypothetical protein